jgi:hypothetical protein
MVLDIFSEEEYVLSVRDGTVHLLVKEGASKAGVLRGMTTAFIARRRIAIHADTRTNSDSAVEYARGELTSCNISLTLTKSPIIHYLMCRGGCCGAGAGKRVASGRICAGGAERSYSAGLFRRLVLEILCDESTKMTTMYSQMNAVH